jgi:hypothetical protein
MDITDFYYRLFLKDLLTLDQNPRKRLTGPLCLKKTRKVQSNLFWIRRNITDITEFTITEYYGSLYLPRTGQTVPGLGRTVIRPLLF